ncbi:MAG TPA: DEAD/DEAH box helicase [Bacillota bacterium]|nr:DEAD/DEAH box helicase [Bacillota bacterium]
MFHPSLNSFHPVVAEWFTQTFGEPTPPQAQGWPLIAEGKNVLLLAPTGSGKTLAAFLKCLDRLYQDVLTGPLPTGVQVLYISPLKALNNDIYRNLEIPLAGIEEMGRKMGVDLPHLTTAIRTGDTPSNERQKMLRRPPQILITTPESLFLLLSSKAREMLRPVRFVIIDEIHTLFPTKRGAHLALSLERLQHLVGTGRTFQRIGLSATMKPLDQAAAYLAGKEFHPENRLWEPRPVEVVDTGQRKALDLKILLPVEDLRELPEKSIWPPIYQQVLDLVRQHRTTLVFVNNRRLAERMTANINELAGVQLARTHHGSVSKEVRLEAEKMLKQGEIPCIVATSSLELGIDIGHIDLVIQIESPKEVARGLQRVGRAGHIVGMPSKGRIIPKTRGDLLESAAIFREMKAGRVESVKAIFNCLDVLAQQLVAMTTEGEWNTGESFQVIRQSYNFNSLSESVFQNVLAMLAGNFETKEFIDLRPRLVWDRNLGIIKSNSYGKRLVYSSGGTIPDRGYYGVYLQGSNLRLGELDEEFVYERRLNERFVLGTSVWKIEELRQDRVIVSPSKKGGEAIVPFWKADPGGRSYELGKRIGAFLGEIENHSETGDLQGWLESECDLSPEVSKNLCRYTQAQLKSLQYLPTDQCLVVEEFPDEIGEWRVLLHSPFGTRLHLALSLIIKAIWEKDLQIQVEAIPTDDGIMFHLQGSEGPPEIPWQALSSFNLEQKLAELVSGSALFGITFRQTAQLSLIMPRTGFGRKRNPFWLSRLKAGNLLHVVAKYNDFPLVIETYRAILQDYFDLSGLSEVLQGLQQGLIKLQRCRHNTPSPFAGSHLFNFIGNFMYEGEAPQGEQRLHMFGLGRETLKVILGKQGIRNIIDAGILKNVTAKVRGLDILDTDFDTDSFESWLEKVGDIFFHELPEQFPGGEGQVENYIQELIRLGKIVCIPEGQAKGLMVALWEAPYYLHGLPGLSPESAGEVFRKMRGQFGSFVEKPITVTEARTRIIQRYVRTHGPFKISDITKRYGFSKQEVATELAIMATDRLVESGEFTPGGNGEEWCEIGILEEIHRRSLAQARKEIEARGPFEYGAFLAKWQGVGGQRKEFDGLTATLDQLSGLWLPAGMWENSVLPGRVRKFSPALLDQLIASGQFFWRARGHDQQIQLCFEKTIVSGNQNSVAETFSKERIAFEDINISLSHEGESIRRFLQTQGASSLPQILQATKMSTVHAWQTLEELIAKSIVTNDTLGPIRHLLQSRPGDRVGARGVLSMSVIAQMGRWSLLPSPNVDDPNVQASTLMNRYGIICREMVQQESVSWGESYVYYDLLEQIGKIRRGFFCSHLSGIQFALPSAIEKLRLPPNQDLPEFYALQWNDPANYLNFMSDWTSAEPNLSGSFDFIVFHAGKPVLTAGGKKLRIHCFENGASEYNEKSLEKLMKALLVILYRVYRDQKITITHWNGLPVMDTGMTELLTQLGFEKGMQEMTLWPSARKENTVFEYPC